MQKDVPQIRNGSLVGRKGVFMLPTTPACLARMNDVSEKYGLRLTNEQIARLDAARAEALSDTGRMEFSQGVMEKMVYAFCDSPYLRRDNYEETLARLQDAFYRFKGEAMERLGDDEVVALMRRLFDEPCQGDIDYLEGTVLDEIARGLRA